MGFPRTTAPWSQTKALHTTCVSVFMFPLLVAERRRAAWWERTSLSSFSQGEHRAMERGWCTLPVKGWGDGPSNITARGMSEFWPTNYSRILSALWNSFVILHYKLCVTAWPHSCAKIQQTTLFSLFSPSSQHLHCQSMNTPPSSPHTNKASIVHFN